MCVLEADIERLSLLLECTDLIKHLPLLVEDDVLGLLVVFVDVNVMLVEHCGLIQVKMLCSALVVGQYVGLLHFGHASVCFGCLLCCSGCGWEDSDSLWSCACADTGGFLPCVLGCPFDPRLVVVL